MVMETVESLGLHMQALQSESRAEKLSGVCKEFMEVKEEDEEQTKRVTLLEEMIEVCSAMPAKIQKIEGHKELFGSVFQEVVGFVAPLVFQPQTPEPAPDMTKTLQMLTKMMEMFDLGSVAHKTFMDAFQTAAGLKTKATSMMQNQPYDLKTVFLSDDAKDKVLALRRSCLSVDASHVKMQKLKEKPDSFEKAWVLCKTYQDWCQKVVDEIVKELLQESETLHAEKSRALTLVAGGRRDGTTWTDQIGPKTSWKQLCMKVIDGVLMDISPQILPAAIDECIQVRRPYS